MSESFAWGEVIERRTLEISDTEKPEVVKYHPWKTEGVFVQRGVPDESAVLYHLTDVRHSFGSFHAALIAWIAYQRLGLNQQTLADGVCRALGVTDDILEKVDGS